MGELTAKKDQSLSGCNIRYLEPEPDSANDQISGQPEPDIRYIPTINTLILIKCSRRDRLTSNK